MKIVLLGASGLLGQELLKLDAEMIFSVERINISNFHQIRQYLHDSNPDIIINCAAITNNREIEQNSSEAIRTNIIGAANIALIAKELNCRYVYISTDYVYNGNRYGNHDEQSDLNPENLYAWTKLGGECSAKCVNDYLIIRTSFGTSVFPYKEAFTSLFTSKDYVDKISPMILRAVTSNYKGVLNIGTDRKTMYEYAKIRNPKVTMVYDEKKDFTLNTSKYNEIR